jgi:hypothetical protein
MKIVKNFENGQTVTSLSGEPDLESPTVKTVLEDCDRMQDRVKSFNTF